MRGTCATSPLGVARLRARLRRMGQGSLLADDPYRGTDEGPVGWREWTSNLRRSTGGDASYDTLAVNLARLHTVE